MHTAFLNSTSQGRPTKVRLGKVLSLDCSVVACLYVELPGKAQNTREGGDIRKTRIGGSSTKLAKVGKNKVFPWTKYGCSNIIAIGSRLLLLFQHMEPMQELKVILNKVWCQVAGLAG